MIFLTSNTQSLVLSINDSSQVDWNISYVDMDTATGATAGSAQGSVISASDVSLTQGVTGIQRQVKLIHVLNNSASIITIDLWKAISGGQISFIQGLALGPFEALSYLDTTGFEVLTQNGQKKVQLTGLGSGSVTSVDVSSTTLTSTGGPITEFGVINVELPAQASSGTYTSANITVDGFGRVTAASSGSGAGGTVTSVDVIGNDGIVSTGGPITSTGSITLDLGDITPTSVVSTGPVTGSNIAGNNTGDQTITATGDVSGVSTGSPATSLPLTLADVATAGSFTNANITIDSKGRVLTASNGTGGSGLPAGLNTQIQYNDNGAFGASPNLTFDGTKLGVGGNIELQGLGRRLIANMADGTISNRFAIQNSVANTSTVVTVLPTALTNTSGVNFYLSSDPTNSSYAGMFMFANVYGAGNHAAYINSGARGTGPVLPLIMQVTGNGVNAGKNAGFTLEPNGNVSQGGIGTTLTTTAATGFFWLAATPGVPTGIPQNPIASPFNARLPITIDNTTGNLYTYAAGSWHNQGGGGGGSPAGANNDIQYNLGGSFAADTGLFTYDSTNKRLKIANLTITQSINQNTSVFNTTDGVSGISNFIFGNDTNNASLALGGLNGTYDPASFTVFENAFNLRGGAGSATKPSGGFMQFFGGDALPGSNDVGGAIFFWAGNGDGGNTAGSNINFITPGLEARITGAGELLLDNIPGAAGQVLSSQGPGLPITWANAGGGGSAAGNNTEVQFNNAGAFGASDAFTWDTATKALSVKGDGSRVQAFNSIGTVVASMNADTTFNSSFGLAYANGNPAFFAVSQDGSPAHCAAFNLFNTIGTIGASMSAGNDSSQGPSIALRGVGGNTGLSLNGGNNLTGPDAVRISASSTLGSTVGIKLETVNNGWIDFTTGTGDFRINGNPGSSGQVLTSQGNGAAPIWSSAGGGSSSISSLTNATTNNILSFGGFDQKWEVSGGVDFIAPFQIKDTGVTSQAMLMLQAGMAQNPLLITDSTLGAELFSVTNQGQVNVGVGATGGGLRVDSPGGVQFTVTNTGFKFTANDIFEIDSSGAFLFVGTPGGPGDVLTSNGAGLQPTWQTPVAVTNITVGTPASSTAAGVTGTIMKDNDYIYICIETDKWWRSPLTAW